MESFTEHNGNRFFGIMMSVIFLSFFILMPVAMGDEEPVIEDELPAFSNPAQAQRAENLANIAALEPDAETVAAIVEAEDKKTAVETTREYYDKLLNDPLTSPADLESALAALNAAQQDYENAQTIADQKLADFVGATKEEIVQMRADGMGWGDIAHELGIHPGTLGLGHTKGKLNRNRWADMNQYGSLDEEEELQAATGRNLKTGWAKGKFDDDGDDDASPGNSGNKEKGNSKDKDKDKNKNK